MQKIMEKHSKIILRFIHSFSVIHIFHDFLEGCLYYLHFIDEK